VRSSMNMPRRSAGEWSLEEKTTSMSEMRVSLLNNIQVSRHRSRNASGECLPTFEIKLLNRQDLNAPKAKPIPPPFKFGGICKVPIGYRGGQSVDKRMCADPFEFF